MGTDFMRCDSLLPAKERLVRDTTRAFVKDRLSPITEQWFREGRFPRELVQPMGAMGFFRANLYGFGCAGMNSVEYGLLEAVTRSRRLRY